MTAHVAMIGLGRMGGPIADNVLAAGFTVAVYDVAAASMQARVERGARAATSPADAATGADVVDIVVLDDAQVLDVVDGPEGVLRTLAPDAVICVHTTIEVPTIHEVATRAADHGVHVIDAGISGGESGAADGTLLTMVGGDKDALERARPVLDSFSKQIIHAGVLGTGMALKLARNATAYAMMGVVHEALVLAAASDVDLAMLREALTTTGVWEQALVPLGFGAPGPFPPGTPESFLTTLRHSVTLAAKDLAQARALADAHAVPVPHFDAVQANYGEIMRVEARR